MNLYLNKKTFDLNDFQNDRISLANYSANDTYGDEPLSLQCTVISNSELITMTISFKLNAGVISDVTIYNNDSVQCEVSYNSGIEIVLAGSVFDMSLGILNISAIDHPAYNQELLDNWTIFNSGTPTFTNTTYLDEEASTLAVPYYPVFGAKGITTEDDLRSITISPTYGLSCAKLISSFVGKTAAFISHDGLLYTYGENLYYRGGISSASFTYYPTNCNIPTLSNSKAHVVDAIMHLKGLYVLLSNGELWLSGQTGRMGNTKHTHPIKIHGNVKRLFNIDTSGDKIEVALFILTHDGRVFSLGATVYTYSIRHWDAFKNPTHSDNGDINLWSEWGYGLGGFTDVVEVSLSSLGCYVCGVLKDGRVYHSYATTESESVIVPPEEITCISVSLHTSFVTGVSGNVYLLKFDDRAGYDLVTDYTMPYLSYLALENGSLYQVPNVSGSKIAHVRTGPYGAYLVYTPGKKRAFFWGYAKGRHPFGITSTTVNASTVVHTPVAIDLPFLPQDIKSTTLDTNYTPYGKLGSAPYVALDTAGEVWVGGSTAYEFGTRASNPTGEWFALNLPVKAVEIKIVHEDRLNVIVIRCADNTMWAFGRDGIGSIWTSSLLTLDKFVLSAKSDFNLHRIL